ncbi:MAG: nucleoside phosphorylase [Proteobacteria bacterium]|nr:MAG: nucleoside phosphorylase [Pseudomonadota bacterium]
MITINNNFKLGKEMKQPHINCSKEDIHPRVIICGDPARVERIAEFGTDYKFISSNREFTVYETIYNNLPYTICSTGIGGPSTAIAIEELVRCGAQAIIRVGSAGSLQNNINNGSLVIAEGAVRQEGTSKMYVEPQYPAISDTDLIVNLKSFLNKVDINYHSGIIFTHDSFYTDHEEEICKKWSNLGILAKEMEAATLLTLARLRKIKAAAILTVVVEFSANKEDGINNYKDLNDKLLRSEHAATEAAFYALSQINFTN